MEQLTPESVDKILGELKALLLSKDQTQQQFERIVEILSLLTLYSTSLFIVHTMDRTQPKLNIVELEMDVEHKI